MRGKSRWERSWSEANSRLVHNARRVGDEDMRNYWDRRSGYYGELTRGDEAPGESVIGYLAREKILVSGDRVLDVGCGTGQYTLPLAKIAGTVSGLDISQGMLDRMMQEAAARGLTNIHPICSSWERYEGEEKYDLAFSAFCPGVNDPDGLFKMERFSSRSCCFVTGGGIGQPAFIYDLMEILTGEAYPVIDTDDFFSFNVLLEAGRKPAVRSFSYRSAPPKGEGHDIDNAILYFDMLLGPDPERKKIIVDYFEAHTKDEEIEEEQERSLYVVSWRPGKK